MTNLEALKTTCNAICNTFYPDHATLELTLFNAGINHTDNAAPGDIELVKLAIGLVVGYVEQSRTENGVSTSNFEERVKQSIQYWCSRHGIDASEFVALTTIQNGSARW
ncbi:hypothetical protein D0T49_12115 [Paludibacter sp. 221]|uniref:hypothetical protein n=1 Tax=Paludibacter sp. 221 TaxID=2302939 RepID=UPI0013D6ED41|nr:hypothetical protein [Paludibacter sp. 221]NDV47791.1 hypothetical protein [Paludibacter sp. 221]